MSASLGAQWLFSSLVSATFPFMRDSIGSSTTVMIYALAMIPGWFFVLAYMPETKGLSLEVLNQREGQRERERMAAKASAAEKETARASLRDCLHPRA
mgnify:CR=1 FL=1